MSAMVVGPAMPSQMSIAVANRRSSTTSGRRSTSSARTPAAALLVAPARPASSVAPAPRTASTGSAASAAPVQLAGPAESVAHLRLTARGRAVLWFLAAALVALVSLVASQASADGPVAAQEVVRHVVQPGETLWQIAESIAAPSQDVRDVVVDLVVLNELPDAGLMAGQVIVVPAG